MAQTEYGGADGGYIRDLLHQTLSARIVPEGFWKHMGVVD